MRCGVLATLLTLILLGLSCTRVFAGDIGLKNPSFENGDPPNKPPDWFAFTDSGEDPTVEITAERTRTGNKCLKMYFHKDQKFKIMGVGQEFEVKPNTKYRFSAWFRSTDLRNASNAYLGLEWKASDHKEISRTRSIRTANRANVNDEDWVQLEMVARSPGNAAKAAAVITLSPANSYTGSILIDDVRLEEVPD